MYRNLWPSLREFWLSAFSRYADETYIVYEDQRLTYRQVHTGAIKVAGLLRQVYGIQKGNLELPSFPNVILINTFILSDCRRQSSHLFA